MAFTTEPICTRVVSDHLTEAHSLPLLPDVLLKSTLFFKFPVSLLFTSSKYPSMLFLIRAFSLTGSFSFCIVNVFVRCDVPSGVISAFFARLTFRTHQVFFFYPSLMSTCTLPIGRQKRQVVMLISFLSPWRFSVVFDVLQSGHSCFVDSDSTLYLYEWTSTGFSCGAWMYQRTHCFHSSRASCIMCSS